MAVDEIDVRAADEDGTADGAGEADGARRLTRRRLAVGALLAVACAIVAIVLLSGGGSKGSTPATGVPAGDTTATVTRRTLTESSTADGTLGYGATLELYDRLGGTFTWLPSVGATIARGGTLFRVNNLPVALMYGSVPAYRTLKRGVSHGPDVEQLNDNLIALGYDPYGAITNVSSFGEATAAAVRRWQKAEGLRETGEVELGRVVFAPSARRVTTVHVALGQDPPGSADPSVPNEEGAPSKPGNESSESTKPDESTKPGEKAKPEEKSKPSENSEPKEKSKPEEKGNKPDEPGRSPEAGKQPKEGKSKEHGNPEEKGKSSEANKPTGEDKSKNEGKSKSDGNPDESSAKEPGGAGASAGELVLSTTSTQQLVQLKLKAEQQQLAHIGEQAPVTLPGGETVQGRIIEVGTVASEAKSGNESEKGPGGSSGSPGGEGSGESTIPVTLALTHRVPHLDQAPVSVDLVKEVRRNVLAVPATALVATAGGGYAIELLEDDRRVELAVTPGMFANGYVQVEGHGLHEGQTVIESE